MKKVIALVALAALATTALPGAPVLVGTYAPTPSGNLGLTVSINWNDSATASGFFALTATSTNIQQVQAFGFLSANTLQEAQNNEAIPGSGYVAANDSWWWVGPGTPWSTGTPPFGGVDAATGLPGSNSYRASYGSDVAQPMSGQVPILYLVTSDPEGDVNISGTMARLGVDYPVDQNFSNAPANPVLDASGGSAGNVRVGTSGGLLASATNVGAGSLNGTFPTASSPFSGGGSAFGPLGAGGSANEPYTYTPTARGADSQNLTVTSNGGSAQITLSGNGVGPVFADDDADDMIDVGNVFGNPNTPGNASFTISNVTTDGNLGALTDLTITSVSVIDNDGKVLFSTDLVPGTVIPAGGSHVVNVTGTFGFAGTGPSTGTLIIGTDEGAALGGDGADYTFVLKGNAVPEPSTIALAVFGGLGLVGLALRRRNG